MIHFDKFTLSNGLKVLVHKDNTTPFAIVNLLYNVGARDEHPDKTGFAHLFEHLMFGGSINIPEFDTPIQLAGGENNAFTNNDYTNYYITIPKVNIETAFWLESDRMLSLEFSEKSLEVQRHVVIEEFKQRYLNQPYGDLWLLVKPLIYKEHPYQWATIGKDISHIENATMDDVKSFFFKHYAPNNAILTIAGDVETDEIKALAEKWFGPIEQRNIEKRNLPKEPAQTEARTLTVERNVPFDLIFKAYHICDRYHPDFHATDMITDILSNGKSSRMYQSLVQEQKIFSEIDAFVSGDLDAGFIGITGKLIKGESMARAEAAIIAELEKIKTEAISDYELSKVKNKLEATTIFAETQPLSKAMDLAYFELLGDGALINNDIQKYLAVTVEDIKRLSNEIFLPTNCSTLYYLSKEKEVEPQITQIDTD